MRKSRKKGTIGIVITIIILVLLVLLTNINTEKISYIEATVSKLVTPIQNGLTYLKNKIEKNNTFFTDIHNLKTENEELKEENNKLEQALRELEIIKAENATLKEYVGLADQYKEYKTIPAYIINKDVSNYSSTIIINVGQKSGVQKNMTVVADKGLVGHIISVTDNTAKVQVIVDTASTVSATISNTRESIILRGTLEKENAMKAMYIPTDANLIIGDNIETSGMGGIFKKGIHIGKIEEIIETKNITDRYVIVKADVDFSKLETVAVIIE